MTFSIVRISGIHYDGAKKVIDESVPIDQTFSNFQNNVFGLNLVYGSAFSKSFNELGYDAYEILYDLDVLQKKWLEENNILLSTKKLNISDRDFIVLEQLKKIKPTIVYFQDVYGLSYPLRKKIKELCPSVKLTVLHKGYPSSFDEMDSFDLIYFSLPSIVEIYKKRGINCKLHYHAFNQNVLGGGKFSTKKNNGLHSTDIVFTGSSGFGHGAGHAKRYWMLYQLLNKKDVICYLDEIFDSEDFMSTSQKVKKFMKYIFGKFRHLLSQNLYDSYPVLPLTYYFPKNIFQPLFGMQMYDVFNSSLANLNIHADATGESVGNLRLFEVSGVGGCQITNYGSNIHDLFEPDKEIITYNSFDELNEKIKYLKNNKNVAFDIGKNAQKRCLKDHTIKNRVEKLINDFIKVL